MFFVWVETPGGTLPEHSDVAEIKNRYSQDESLTLAGLSRSSFARFLAYFLGIFGLGGFFALSFSGMMGDNYTDFYDEDVSFFDKQLDGEDDRLYYWILMSLSFVLAFFSTLYRDTTRSIRNRLVTADNSEFEILYDSYYGSKTGYFFISLFSVSWETVFETLWIFIALTDMFGVIFVLAGRYAGVIFLTYSFERRFVNVQIGRLGKNVSTLSSSGIKNGVSSLTF